MTLAALKTNFGVTFVKLMAETQPLELRKLELDTLYVLGRA